MKKSASTIRTAVKITNFYPFAINLRDRKVLVLGGGDHAYREALRLVDAGALITIVSPQVCREIDELLLTHASQATIVYLSAEDYLIGEPSLTDFDLAFLISEEDEENDFLAQKLASRGVPFDCLYQPEKSKFVTATSLKRGHLKIAVSTDGLCHPLERAISRRIEELFVSDFDHYSLFLSALDEKLQAYKGGDRDDWLELNRRLEGEDFYLALSRQNFDEALRLIDHHIEAIERGLDSDYQIEEAEEEEINRPRYSAKNAKGNA